MRHAEEMGLHAQRTGRIGGPALHDEAAYRPFTYPLPRMAGGRHDPDMGHARSSGSRPSGPTSSTVPTDGRMAARGLLDGILVDAATRRPIRFDMGGHHPRRRKRGNAIVDAGADRSRRRAWIAIPGSGTPSGTRPTATAISTISATPSSPCRRCRRVLPEGRSGTGPSIIWRSSIGGPAHPALFAHVMEADTVIDGGAR